MPTRIPSEDRQVTVWVYALVDPRDGRIRYVGQTQVSVNVRVREHMRKCTNPKNNKHSARWLRQLAASNLQPSYMILDVGDARTTDALEEFYVASLREAGFDLTNETNGG